jgi:hypothetical protein
MLVDEELEAQTLEPQDARCRTMRERKSRIGGQNTATLRRMTLAELVSSSAYAILRFAQPVVDDLDRHGA